MIRKPCSICETTLIDKHRRTRIVNGKTQHIMSRHCVMCERDKRLEHYERKRNNPVLWEKHLEANKKWKKNNREKVNKIYREWSKKNKEKKNKYYRDYYKKNSNKILLKNKSWREKNKKRHIFHARG